MPAVELPLHDVGSRQIGNATSGFKAQLHARTFLKRVFRVGEAASMVHRHHPRDGKGIDPVASWQRSAAGGSEKTRCCRRPKGKALRSPRQRCYILVDETGEARQIPGRQMRNPPDIHGELWAAKIGKKHRQVCRYVLGKRVIY
jgi:hypothetical protein